MVGKGFESDGPRTLRSTQPTNKHRLSIHVLTKHPSTAKDWRAAILDSAASVDESDIAEQRAAHRRWWGEFWQRSWIHASGTEEAETVSRG
jgi:hypothetical protein